MRFLSFTGILCLLLTFSFAQNPSIEQLIEQANGASDIKERITLYLEIAEALETTDANQALKYATDALELSKTLNDEENLAKSYFRLGKAHIVLKNRVRASRSFENGLEFLDKKEKPFRLLQSYRYLFFLNEKLGRKKRSLKYQLLFSQLEDSLKAIKTSEQIAAMATLEEEYKEASIAAQEETNEVLGMLEESQAVALRREAEIAQLEKEAAELAAEVAETEREAQFARAESAIKDLELNKTRNRRNIMFAIAAVLLLIMFGIWQRSRYLAQRKTAKLEQQRAERLEQIDKLKDQFLANTSHELRTPLNGIIGIAESLHDGVARDDHAAQQENLGMIIASGRRLSNLVNDILDFSKLKNSELDLQLKTIHLRSLAEVIVRINRSLATGRGIALENQIEESIPGVLGDENRIQQILYNLVDNAIKFSNEGTVELAAHKEGEFVVIAVKDEGLGIAPNNQKQIFEAFQQADGSAQRAYSGTGLGLSISRKLVELQGGKMWLESELGKGSTFFFSLPVSAEKAIPSTAAINPASLAKIEGDVSKTTTEGPVLVGLEAENNVHILVVDDEPINQQVIKNHLSNGPYIVTQAFNGKEALEALAEHGDIDMVLLDIMMPRMSGYEVCREIREEYSPSQLPVIMITAKNQVSDLVEGLTYGANDYLAKPFSKEEFLARIKTHLNLAKIHGAYRHFVPHEFLRNLGRDSIVDVRRGDQAEREVTIMFSDIRAYTTLSETMTPQENFKFLNSYLGRIGPVISKHNGFVNQYYGDGMMALFLSEHSDAITASINMQKVITAYNVERHNDGRKPIRVGIGLHSGPIIMGILGDHKRMDPNVVSDAVNTSSRMEGLTKFYGASVLVSEATLAGLSDPFEYNYRFLGKVQVKGKKESIGVYEFFDGDAPELIELKLKTFDDFEAGIRTYYARDFEQAIASFEAVLAVNPEDKPALYYQEKARKLTETTIPVDWDGVERMETK
ncbi:MAG: response regulator [Bacteroidia bacterium]